MQTQIGKTIKCGLCSEIITGSVRDLNRHKGEKHPEERAAMRARHKAQARRGGASINHCESCSKFVSLEISEPEDNGVDVDEEGNISGSMRLTLNCVDCSTELAETELSIEDSVECEHEEACVTDNATLSLDYNLEVGEEGGGRFSKHLYFVQITGEISCAGCSATAPVDLLSDKVAASYFESCQ